MKFSPQMDRCPQCIHKRETYGKALLCTAMNQAIPVESARHERGHCGPDAWMYDDGRARDYADEDA